MTAFGEAGVPTLGLEEEVGCNPRVTFDGKVRNLGPCVLKFDSPQLKLRVRVTLRSSKFVSSWEGSLFPEINLLFFQIRWRSPAREQQHTLQP